MEVQMRHGADLSAIYPVCPACGVSPVDPHTGNLMAVDAKRWWCGEHVHMAAPGDMAPRGSGIRLSPGGVPVEHNPLEIEREIAEQHARERRHQAQLAARSLEAEQRRRQEKAANEAFKRELPEGFR
jgi:hypothetical protein